MLNLRLAQSVLCFLVVGLVGTLNGQDIEADERSFKKIKAHYEAKYKDAPIKGQNKRALRSMHYWESRLDKDGNILNSTLANLQALEQLYIDTLPAVIQGDWSLLGPLYTTGSVFNQEGNGRVNQIAFATEDIWYVGTAGGGLWRTDVGGAYAGIGPYPWYSLTDSLPTLGISGIAVHPTDEDDVYILTGDGEGRRFATRGEQPGIGILHTTDGGMSWDTTALKYGLTQQQAGFKLARYPGAIDTMFAACTDSLYRTTDGWNSYTAAIGLRCYDIEFKPGNPQTVYAACKESLQRSTDGGITFTSITGNLVQDSITPYIGMERIAIGVSPNAPNVLYVLISKDDGGLMSFQVSNDSGDSFTEKINNLYNILGGGNPLTTRDGQGNYDLSLWVDPTDATIVIVGAVNLWKSSNSGGAWTELANWTNSPPLYVHADIHAIESNPFTGNIVVGSDGGLYESNTDGLFWTNRGKGLGIMQYYHLDVFTGFLGIPIVAGGAQDNGTSTGFGFDDPVFEMIGGGDGFDTYRGSYDGFPVRYRSVQAGKLYRQDYDPFFEIWDQVEITPAGAGKGVWDTPYQPNQNVFNELLAGYKKLYFSNTLGDSWVELDFPAIPTYDVTGIIRELIWSKSSANVVFFYRTDSTRRDIWKCETLFGSVITGSLEDATCQTFSLDELSTNPAPNMGDFAMSAYNSDEIWISIQGYIDSMKVYYNQDIAADSSWVNLTYNLPNVPVHCVEWDIDGIYAGTDIGAFFLPNGEEHWIYFSKGLPTSAVTEIEVKNTIQGKLVFASTYGRGIWWSHPPSPNRRTRWYVDSSAVLGMNTGANWTNAFTNLQVGLNSALPGDSIWVAKGTYFPGTSIGFQLDYDNVFIWGGFDGTEDSIGQRDFINNETVLSGDMGILGDSTDNANHVFYFQGYNGNVLLDGFHIRDGNAHDTGENSKGGGIYYSTGSSNGKPHVSNCRIYNNTAYGNSGSSQHHGYGGGMYIADYDDGDPDMHITNCVFENNVALGRGGGLYIESQKISFPQDTGTAVVYLDTCSFIGNSSFEKGGAIAVDAGRTSKVILYIDSCRFENNVLTWQHGDGAGIHFDANTGSPGTLDVEISRSFFSENIGGSQSEGGAIYIDGLGAETEFVFFRCAFSNNTARTGGAIQNYCPNIASISTLDFNRCNFANNSAVHGGAIHLDGGSQAHTEANFSNCDFSDNSASSEGGGIYFLGNNAGNFESNIDSCTFSGNTAYENGAIKFYFRTLASNSLVPGAGELTLSNCLFYQNSGSDFTSGGGIGLYSDKGRITAQITATDFIENYAGLRGGAVSHEHVTSDSSFHNVTYTNCDFTENKTLFSGASAGGAIYFDKTNATSIGCNFIENESKLGGAIYNATTLVGGAYTQSFDNCQFVRNKGTEFGGAIYNLHNSPTTMLVDITESLFDSNFTTSALFDKGRGGAIYSSGTGRSVQHLSGSIFQDNFASKKGGALYYTGQIAPIDTVILTIDSCAFLNNDADVTGETIELAGVNMWILSQWMNCNFTNDEPGEIFLNKQSATGISHATFSDCFIYLIGGGAPQSASAAMPESLEPIFVDDQ